MEYELIEMKDRLHRAEEICQRVSSLRDRRDSLDTAIHLIGAVPEDME